jgi:hypothetical protein
MPGLFAAASYKLDGDPGATLGLGFQGVLDTSWERPKPTTWVRISSSLVWSDLGRYRREISV